MIPASLTAPPLSLNVDGRTETAIGVDQDGTQLESVQDAPDDETTLFSDSLELIRFEDVLSQRAAAQTNDTINPASRADVGSIGESVDAVAVFGQRNSATGTTGQLEAGGDLAETNAGQNAGDAARTQIESSLIPSTEQELIADAVSASDSPLNADGEASRTEQQQDPTPSDSERQTGDPDAEIDMPKPTQEPGVSSLKESVSAESGSTVAVSETRSATVANEAMADVLSDSTTNGGQVVTEGQPAKNVETAARLANETAPVEQIRRTLAEYKAEFVREEPMRLEVRLDPPELGRIWIRVERTENGLSAQLSVQDENVRLALESHVDDVQRELGESGLSFAGFGTV